MEDVRWTERVKYAFDNFMAKGTIALMTALAAVTAAMITVAATLLVITGIAPEGAESLSPAEAWWAGLMHALDAGAVGGDAGWAYRIVMFVVTLGGIFILSALIGVINAGLESRLDALRKGRSRVIERDHVVVLGWSPQVFPILSELEIANASRADACVVVMGEADKVEMEEAVREKLGDIKTRVVCRSGSPIDMDDLRIVSLNSARAILIIAPDSSENPDADVIKTLLAVVNHPHRRQAPYHIIAELHDPQNVDVAKMVGKDELELIQIGSLISRIAAQTCRQSGLSVVYTELLDFDGDEIYFREEAALVGKRYAEALHAYRTSTVIGLVKKGQKPQLNPPMDTVLQAGDQLVLVASDDSAIRLEAASPPAVTLPPLPDAPPAPEVTLVLGWNWRVPSILEELDRYVPAGSTAQVVAMSEEAESLLSERCSSMKNLAYTLISGDTTDRRVLDGLMRQQVDHVIVIAEEGLSTQGADARTLITLLHLRDIASKTGQDFSIVSEMRDLRNRALAEATRADDFIISDRLLSLMMAQVAETKALNDVFTDIFDPEGAEVYLKPAARYAPIGVPVDFHAVVAAAAMRGETAFGYRISANARDAGAAYGVKINPDKSTKVTFTDADRIIVMADA